MNEITILSILLIAILLFFVLSIVCIVLVKNSIWQFVLGGFFLVLSGISYFSTFYVLSQLKKEIVQSTDNAQQINEISTYTIKL